MAEQTSGAASALDAIDCRRLADASWLIFRATKGG